MMPSGTRAASGMTKSLLATALSGWLVRLSPLGASSGRLSHMTERAEGANLIYLSAGLTSRTKDFRCFSWQCVDLSGPPPARLHAG